MSRSVVAQVAPHRFDVDFGQTLGGVTLAEEVLETPQLAELFGDRGGLGEGRAVLAAHAVRTVPVNVGGRLTEVRHQSVHREVQIHVLHHLVEERAQLTLSFGGERVEHRLRGGGPLGHHSNHVLEALGPRKVVTVFRHEVLETRIELFTAAVLFDHLRERVHHFAHTRKLFGVRATHELLGLFEVGVEHVTLEFAQ